MNGVLIGAAGVSVCLPCRSKVDQIVTVGPKQLLRNGLQVVSVTGPR